MNAMINYLLEINVGLLFFMFVYWAVLRNETQFAFKRTYLLFALLGSLIFPLFHFNVTASAQVIPSIGQLIPTYWLPEIVINGNGSASTAKVSSSLSIWTVTEWAYLTAILFLIVLFFYRIISIVKLFTNSHTYRWRNYFVSETDEAKPIFSFFHFILIGQANQLDEKEKEEILIHESIHIKKWHSLDVLLVNMVGIVCWFNPIIRIYKKELVQLHEFEADARSVANKDVDTYCGLLAKVALQSADFPLANHFNNSLTLKRINMMKTMKHKIQNWKVATLVALVPMFFFFVACQEQTANKAAVTDSSLGSTPEYKRAFTELDRLRSSNPKKSYVLIVSEGQHDLQGMENQYSADRLIRINSIADKRGQLFAILELDEQENKTAVGGGEDLIFSVVDETATPKEGMTAFYQFLAENLKYPQEARDAKIQGKVFVQFVIHTDGSLHDFKVVRGIGHGCEEESIRVIKAGPKWNPGKQKGIAVKQRYTLPIAFKLG
ncbi:MAG: M56 family metallopeptidase [Flammeovirgaceae bacterium]|jgi:TonB family protein|nr:M56 family metallopeptidase [Flammeovirgaceae bacterium]